MCVGEREGERERGREIGGEKERRRRVSNRTKEQGVKFKREKGSVTEEERKKNKEW